MYDIDMTGTYRNETTWRLMRITRSITKLLENRALQRCQNKDCITLATIKKQQTVRSALEWETHARGVIGDQQLQVGTWRNGTSGKLKIADS